LKLATCPASIVKIDRSFANPFPVCVRALEASPIAKGTPWGSGAVDVSNVARERGDCLKLVREWEAAEQTARTNGATGL
jgi:hypothetical protein